MKKRSQYAADGAKLLEPWRNAEIFARARKLAQQPKRYHLLVQDALRKAGCRYWTMLIAWNPHHKPAGCDAGYQTIDYIVRVPGGRFAILIENPNSLKKPHERQAWAAKQELLKDRGIPVVILKHTLSGSEYLARIMIEKMRRSAAHLRLSHRRDGRA